MGFRRSALLLLASACGGDSATANLELRSESRDSLGITIVENEKPVEGSRLDWTITATPGVSIGTLEGEESDQLFGVRSATRLPGGRVVVANGGTSEVRIYDATGRHLLSFGREGEGPGEFTGLSTIAAWPGDSIMAWDFRQRRLSIFDHSGEVGRIFQIEQDEAFRFPQLSGVFPDGSLLLSASSAFTSGETETGLTRRDRQFARAGSDGKILGSLGTHAGSEAFVQAGADFVSVAGHPFARSSVSGIWADLALISPNDGYEIRAYGPNGDLRRIVRREHTLIDVTQEHLDAEIEDRLADADDERRARLADMYEEMPLTETFPAFSNLVTDALGYFWVREYQLPGDDRQIWTVFDPEGRVEGFVETPMGLTVWEIGEDYVLGRATDELDVEYVRLYGLVRSAGGEAR